MDLFDSLKDLGFSNLSDISIYNENNSAKKNAKSSHQEKSPESFLYSKKVDCPVCSSQFNARAVKTSGIRALSRDTDFMTYYQEPNPMFYDVWVCTSCGYAALSAKFNAITDKHKKLIKENISAKWKSVREYPEIYNIEIAIEMHQLALLNSVVKQSKDSEKALICLKLAWLYRLKNDIQNELKFLLQSQKGFMNALEKESPPIAGLDEPSVEYLIGEIYRRLEIDSNALQWFSRVISSRDAKEKIKDMARTQRALIREQQKKDEGRFIL